MPPASHTMVTTSFGTRSVSSDRLVHRLAVDRAIPVEPQEPRHGRSDARQRHRTIDALPDRHEPRPVPEHRDMLQVIPRAHVRQARADEIGLLRDERELGGADRGSSPRHVREQVSCGREHASLDQVVVGRLARADNLGTVRPRSRAGRRRARAGGGASGSLSASVPDLAPNDNRGGSLDDVASGRRLTLLVVVLALVGAPAVALTAFCIGESCAQEERVTAAVPFCPLPADLGRRSSPGSGRGARPT